MEDVGAEEFVAWFFTSGTFVIFALIILAWRLAERTWLEDRRKKRRWLEQGHDDAGRRVVPKPPKPNKYLP